MILQRPLAAKTVEYVKLAWEDRMILLDYLKSNKPQKIRSYIAFLRREYSAGLQAELDEVKLIRELFTYGLYGDKIIEDFTSYEMKRFSLAAAVKRLITAAKRTRTNDPSALDWGTEDFVQLLSHGPFSFQKMLGLYKKTIIDQILADIPNRLIARSIFNEVSETLWLQRDQLTSRGAFVNLITDLTHHYSMLFLRCAIWEFQFSGSEFFLEPQFVHSNPVLGFKPSRYKQLRAEKHDIVSRTFKVFLFHQPFGLLKLQGVDIDVSWVISGRDILSCCHKMLTNFHAYAATSRKDGVFVRSTPGRRKA